MNTKLTLRMEDKLVVNAKELAKAKGVSLSQLVSEYFRVLLLERPKIKGRPPILNEITGILSEEQDISEVEATYHDHLDKKYR